MKSRHKIALAALISLGILTWAPAANAKSVNSTNKVNRDNSSRIINVAKHHRVQLPTNLNRPDKIIRMNSQKRLNVDRHSVTERHLSQNKITARKVTQNSVKIIEKRSNLQKAKKSQKAKIDESKLKRRKNNHSNKAEDLTYNHTQMPDKPRLEKNHQMIGGMNQFVQKRQAYRYLQVGPNTRDLGGYPTADHKYRTKVGRIIRSAGLDGLSKSGINALQQLHVNKIVDLRYQNSKSGIQGHPDPNELHGKTLKGTHIVYQMDPVYSHDEAEKFSHYMKHHDVRGEYYFYGAPSVTEPQAIRAYRKIFMDLLTNRRGAILFHCNLGRDRTGVTSALILSALGVNRNVICHDYLLTDRYHYKFHHQPYDKPAGELEYFFNTIDWKYGSVNNYIHRKIGLTKHGFNHLRSMYLVPAKTHQIVIQPHRLKRHDLNSTSKKDSPAKKANHQNHQK